MERPPLNGETCPHAGHSHTMDECINAFETVRRRRVINDLRRFAPSASHPEYLAILCELARVDLEYQWGAGRCIDLTEYRVEYPELFERSDMVARLTFEWRRQESEYRSRAGHLADRTPAYSELSLSTVGSESHRAETVYFPSAGQEFSGFVLLSEIGQGAFARTFLAQQRGLANRLVVLKLTTTELDEPDTLAQLQHTNIVPIYSVHREQGLTAICMPYYGATTFADITRALSRERKLPSRAEFLLSVIKGPPPVAGHSPVPAVRGTVGCVADSTQGSNGPQISNSILNRLQESGYSHAVLWLVARLADGLQHAHERGVLHEDIKPANILLADDGQPMLIDFNCAKSRSQSTEIGVAGLGGTLPYMSPTKLRQIRDGVQAFDHRSDIYSLGLVLRELLVGPQQAPCAEMRWRELLEYWIQLRDKGYSDVASASPELTPAVDAILTKCLAANPQQGYQSAAELSQDIDRHLSDLPLRFARERSWIERMRKWRRRNRQLTAILSVVAASLFGLALLAGVALRLQRSLRAATADVTSARIRDGGRELLSAKDRIDVMLSLDSSNMAIVSKAIAECESAVRTWDVVGGDLPKSQVIGALTSRQKAECKMAVAEMCTTIARGKLYLAQAMVPESRGPILDDARYWNDRSIAEFSPHVPRSLQWQQQAIGSLHGGSDARVDLSADVPADASAIEFILAAREFMQQGSYGRAVPLLEMATRREPQRFAGWLDLGSVYYRNGNYPLAASAFSTAQALRPDVSRSYFLRGLAHSKMGALQDAEADFVAALSRDPENMYALINLGITQLDQGRPTQAIEAFTKVIQHGELKCWGLTLRVRAHTALGEHAKAEHDMAAALKSEPNDEISWIALGLARADQQPIEAIRCFDEALRLNPLSREALQNKAHVLSEVMGRTDDALLVLDLLLLSDPEFLPALGGRAVLRARSGRRTEAHGDVRQCLAIDRSPFTLYQLAGVFALTSRSVADDRLEAIRLASLAFQSDPKLLDLVEHDPDIGSLRGQADFEQMISHYRVLQRSAATDSRPSDRDDAIN